MALSIPLLLPPSARSSISRSLGCAGRFSVYFKRIFTLTCLLTLIGCDDSPSRSNGETAGAEVAGAEVAGAEVAGSEVAGSEVAGSEVAGAEVAGAEVAGAEVAGAEVRPACGSGPACPQGYSCECVFETTCECVAPINRSGCDDRLTCRDGETCRAFEKEDGSTEHMCWLDPESLAVTHLSSLADEEVLFAGASSMSITPQGFETPTPEGLNGAVMNFAPPIMSGDPRWRDCGYDGLCPDDQGYTGPDDGEGDGELQGVFIAGFSHGRPAQYCPEELIGCDRPECCASRYAHDDLKAQVVVLRRGNVTVALVALDVIGLFHTEIEHIRRELKHQLASRPELGTVDHILVGASHSHEGPDTVGQYGPGTALPLRSGRDPHWMAYLRAQVTQGILNSLEGLRPAQAQSTLIDEGVEGFGFSDSRPPYIYDDNIPVLHLSDAETDESIATLLSVGNHAEFLWDENPYLSADYFHFTRHYIETGLDAVRDDTGAEVKPALTGLGGVTVMFAGAIGGLINPGRGIAINYAGERFRDHGFEKADAAGQQIASRILAAQREGRFQEIAPASASPSLTVVVKRFLTPIENETFLLGGFIFKLFQRDIYNSQYEGGVTFFPDFPQVLSEVTALQLGSLRFFTAPGEVFPELLTGGYPDRPSAQRPVIGDVEERMTEAVCDERGLPEGVLGSLGGDSPCIVKPAQENPPRWEEAPQAPYGYDLVGQTPFFIGLGGDFLGYIVPPYDFITGSPLGQHYEETNSASQHFAPNWLSALTGAIERLETP